ncbi:MAG: nitrite reductase large subunit NirB [Myxococcales bacterium]|nr:nitrite reductase large subunit NirB [Myxococcales bacterium]
MTGTRRASKQGETIVVVGNGMVGHRLCELLSEGDAQGARRIVVFGDEPRAAYDRVRLSSYFDEGSAEHLSLAEAGFYDERGIELRAGTRVVSIDRERASVTTDAGQELGYDWLVLATGSAPFVPPMAGVELEGVFTYRTIEDLERIASYAKSAKRCAVLGGGLLGLEAARAAQQCGLEAHVVELAPRLMPRQLDHTGARLLARSIEAMGVGLHLGKRTEAIEADSDGRVAGLRFGGGEGLEVEMVIVSAGIRPRDELARSAGLEVGPRGGVVVDDAMRTSDDRIFAIGEVALHRGGIYGLVGPGYEMASVAVQNLEGGEARFEGADLSAKLKLLGVDVASIGDPDVDEKCELSREIVYQDFVKGIYKKLLLSEDGRRLEGAILVGDASEYAQLLQLYRSGAELPEAPESLILGARGGAEVDFELSDEAQVCSCNNVSKGAIRAAIVEQEAHTLEAVAKCTRAGSGCGGCAPMVGDLLSKELRALGATRKAGLCEHFDYSRQELFDLVSVKGIDSFERLIAEHGRGHGCEVCKPTAASIFASVYGRMILEEHATLQDTNDRFLANIQRQGTYSVVPRVPGGEITPDGLIAIGQIAKRFGLYTKITGGQRIDMFGARVEQLPEIWEQLVEAGFESGHAYGKALRTVKSCVGSTWCRFGVQDSVGMAIGIERRYRGLRAPHKLKGAVSGCIRECAEAQSKDFGVIATDKGYNLYVCGNGGARPRHADLLASDLDAETLIRFIDRFLMYYIRTADKLTRTSVWLEKLEGGLEHVRQVVVEDSLGIGAELEAQMQALVDGYRCEWTAVVRDPQLRARFRHFANTKAADDNLRFVPQRGQWRPANWAEPGSREDGKLRLPQLSDSERAPATSWVDVAAVTQVPAEGGIAVEHGGAQIAVFNLASRGRFYAAQNMCPHRRDMVLARGIVGDFGGEPKVACPMHKRAFSLETGEPLGAHDSAITTFPVKVEAGRLFVRLPPAESMAASRSCAHEGHLQPTAPPVFE